MGERKKGTATGGRKSAATVSFLGEGLTLKGTLKFSGDITLHGKFSGEILSGGELIVSETGCVKGNITVDSVKNYGDISGDIEAKTGVLILPGGRVKGDIKTPALKIEIGAVFSGKSEMPPAPVTPPPIKKETVQEPAKKEGSASSKGKAPSSQGSTPDVKKKSSLPVFGGVALALILLTLWIYGGEKSHSPEPVKKIEKPLEQVEEGRIPPDKPTKEGKSSNLASEVKKNKEDEKKKRELARNEKLRKAEEALAKKKKEEIKKGKREAKEKRRIAALNLAKKKEAARQLALEKARKAKDAKKLKREKAEKEAKEKRTAKAKAIKMRKSKEASLKKKIEIAKIVKKEAVAAAPKPKKTPVKVVPPKKREAGGTKKNVVSPKLPVTPHKSGQVVGGGMVKKGARVSGVKNSTVSPLKVAGIKSKKAVKAGPGKVSEVKPVELKTLKNPKEVAVPALSPVSVSASESGPSPVVSARKQAIQSYKKILKVDPSNGEINLKLAQTYFDAGYEDLARSSYDRQGEIDPESIEVMNNRGFYEFENNRYEKSLNIFKQVVLTSPGNHRASFGIVSVYTKQNFYLQAINLSEKILKQNPDLAPFQNKLAWLYGRRRVKLDEAISLSLKSLRGNPLAADYLSTLAILYYQKGEKGKAVAVIKKAIKVWPENKFFKTQLWKFKNT